MKTGSPKIICNTGWTDKARQASIEARRNRGIAQATAHRLTTPDSGLNRVYYTHPIYGPETVGEFLKRQKIPLNVDGTITLYHGRPKGSTYNELREGTLVTPSKEDAAFFAARDRGLKKSQVEVLTMKLYPDGIEPGMFISLRKVYKIQE